MLLGARTGRQEDAYEELKRRIEKAPPPVRSVDATIPEPIDRLISRCLEPDPAKRYQTTSELAAELARLDENGKLLPLVRRVNAAPGGRDRCGRADPARRGTYFVTRRAMEPPAQHAPVSVLIADFQNGTSTPR